MQFFSTILAIATLATAVVLPRGESATVNFDGHQIDAAKGLGALNDLLDASGLNLKRDEAAISRRTDVPGLNCGFQRAERCAGSTSGVLVNRFWAAIETGKDIEQDTACIAAATAFGSALPTDCKLCLGISTS
ncbi:hypothetical protein Slin15195_G119400 [Septoria linicola]|uniref:Fungal calcium binding protein domain-containing protein n=1 Tax=Septoria linicola TaxID=215465 RepID=A0A9Q9EPB6_9PEZI|nr:hypothetical protein Slin14017_G096390 [Septoria linicola]USW58621.1 hypothetical protein Slin15195_G119400 [Septoria linicola]